MTAANSTLYPGIVDIARRKDPNGAIATIVESLAKLSPVVGDAAFVECNNSDTHKFTTRASLPSISARRFNEGVAATKSTTAQTTEPTAMFNAQSIVDEQEMQLDGNGPAFRASEDLAFMEAMLQRAEQAMIYDSHSTDPALSTGLLPRLGSTTTGPAAKQIVKWGSGGTNTNASMLLIGWSPKTVFGIYPKGSTAGIEHKDLGRQLIDPNNDGKKFVGLVSDWTWKLGLAVKDARFVAAVRNIDMATITGGTIGTPVNDLILAAVDAYHKIFQPEAVNLCWYVPRALSAILHKQAVNAVSKSTLTYQEVAGKPVVSLMGVPVKICDALKVTEAAIS